MLDYDTLRAGFNIREFTPVERVLTQFPVLADYIRVILLPRPSVFSLFHDGYPVSHGLWSPPTTLITMLLITALIIGAIVIRKSHPVLSLGVLLFFSGHLLEAGPISLELYFEHRNYFPSTGLVIVIAWIITAATEIKRYKLPAGIFLGLYGVSLAAITLDEAILWTKPEIQVAEWASANPASDRARQELAAIYMMHGEYNTAEKIHEQQAQKYGNDISPVIRLIHIRSCRRGQPTSEQDLTMTLDKAASPLRFNLSATAALDFLVLDVIKNNCPALDPDHLEAIIMTLIENSRSRMDTATLYEFMSSLSINRGNLGQAVEYLRLSLAISYDVDRKAREIMLLGRLNREDERQMAILELERYFDDHPLEYLAYHDIVNRQQ
jgi:tetratricopeptide (TPR) repeat protein